MLWRSGERCGSWESSQDGPSAFEQALAAAGQAVSTPVMPFLERNALEFDDTANMRRALALARRNYGKTAGNPSVGCLIVDSRGELFAEAATAEGGRQHAEEQALEDAGALAEGAVAYVTLEPCRQRSKGGASCSEKLVEAGIGRVVVAIEDPHPNGSGGIDRLRAAGVDVTVGVCRDAASRLYQDFFARAKTANDA